MALSALAAAPSSPSGRRYRVASVLPRLRGAARGRARRREACSACTATSTTTGSTAASPRRRTPHTSRRTGRSSRSRCAAPRSAAAASRSSSICRRGTRRIRGGATRSLYLLHGFPGKPLALPRDGTAGRRRGRPGRPRHRAQPLILAMPFGSTGQFTDKEWANGIGRGQGWETFVARDVVRAIDARYRTIRSGSARGARRPLGGRLRRGQHRHPPPGRVRRRRELVGLHARGRPRRDLRPPTALLARTARSPRSQPRRRALRRAHTFVWFYSGRRDGFRPQNAAFAKRARRRRGSRTGSSSSPAATTGRSGAATPCGRTWRPPGGCTVRRLALPAARRPRSAWRRSAGSTRSSRTCPGPGSARRCRSTSSRTTTPRRSSGSSSSGASWPCCSAPGRAAQGSSA